MLESSLALRNDLEVLGVGVLISLVEGPEWHVGNGHLSGGRTLLMPSRGAPVHRERYGGEAGKQASKAPGSQGNPHRTQRSRILATLEKDEGVYTDTSGYVHRLVKPRTGVSAPQGNRHSALNHIPTLGPTFSVALRYRGSTGTHGHAQNGP